ncbi:MAG: alpha/beta hydrolase [Rhodanobacteraceae bacterium]|nr:alpha/beta hydrolase [Xanthomonadales bacterium]MCP5478414.1 alpha/beta hydrolase [Rhodanobacteraceae bacterium]HPF72558.1 alpha/beta hydrolase [Xanthomonadaceae bacterium]HRX99938.1 alpha/beta hydrolase [Xanthomonadaceae bacterium]
MHEGELGYRGHRLFLRSGGDGPDLWLIHGFPTSSRDWLTLWPLLSKNFRLTAIDMLGFGRSDKPPAFNYSIMASADQWEALAAESGTGDVVVVAHDYGDTVLQELLARQNAGELRFRIRAAVLLNGGIFDDATRPLLIQKLLKGPLGPLVARLSSYRRFAASMRRICRRPPGDEELREHWALLIANGGRRVLPRIIRYIDERRRHRQRWLDALRDSGVPLCHVNGLCDPISGQRIVDCWRERLPDGAVVELADIGHYPQWEAPQAVAAAVLDFLDRHPEQTGR